MDLPRVVATDLDGTLLRTDGHVSGYTREVLGEVEAAGITVVLVTARPPRWMHELEELGVHAVALCGNGAFTYDVAARRVVGHRLLGPEVLAALLADLRDGIPGILLATEGVEGPAAETGWELDDHPGEWVLGPWQELAGRPVGKLLVRHAELSTEVLTDRVAGIVGDRAEVSHSGAVRMTEIGPPGVTKAVALGQWCDEQEPAVDAGEVWAFGDMPNDLPMLTWAGRSFAVANAHPDVVAAATDLVPSNDDDGVARTLAALLG
ncbi:HAD family hydrolase [Ornithinimicrobium avium]|uniref:HAD family hydrolase n=1 Tax=Ornithinimicrobium avium TaxID=2283195 RepID=A0A345NJ27_9MICO|nr:HAD family hydrolase [Ornithinimicrobium avium]AXH95035.1 HAD family hydrolase [Ornithinimicrobium avium]